MELYDIIGPMMVGPSSSHTAGAVKIGLAARKMMGEEIRRAEILLYGSFLATGRGHGTPQALTAGLLKMQPDDVRIPDSLQLAKEAGMEVVFGRAELPEGHPNSALLRLQGVSGKKLELVGESIGGSAINLAWIDGVRADISGNLPALILRHSDRPGTVAKIAGILSDSSINIAKMHTGRDTRGGNAVTVMECDGMISGELQEKIRQLPGLSELIAYSIDDL